MSPSTARRRLRGTVVAVAAVATVAATAATTTTTARASAPTTTSPAKAAAGWLARQLVGPRKDHYAVTFGGSSFADPGMTVDGVLSMDAAGVAQTAAVRMTTWLAAKAKSYANGGGPAGTYYPGSLAKLLLVAEAQHRNVHDFGGINLVRALEREEQPDGSYLNTGATSFGSSPVQQSLALIALSHTGSIRDWPDAKAIAWLVGQQCGDGGFSSSNQSAPAATCTDVDATAYAAQALLTVHSSAAASALRWLRRHDNPDGGFGLDPSGHPTSNANSTAIAVQALLQAGGAAASALSWLRHHQVGCSGKAARRGAVRFAGSFDAATALRATTQAGQALARRWLGHITNNGATAAAPVMACS